MWCCTTSIPGNSSPKNSPITSSSGTYLESELGTCTNLGNKGGTFTLAKCSPFVFGFFRTTARLRDRPEIYGKGCAGSTASGVRTGKTCKLKYSCNFCFSSELKAAKCTRLMFACDSRGANSSLNRAAWRSCNTRVLSEISCRTC